MIRLIMCGRGIDRCLAEIRRSGKKGELAVGMYEHVLTQLLCRGPETAELISKRTKHGEWRIKNCIKYDLGSGYRLITVRIDERLYIPFIGSHDDADLWLERHKNDGFHPDDSKYRAISMVIEESAGTDDAAQKTVDGIDDLYEKQLREKLDDSLLKTVFQGLYQQGSELKNQHRRPATGNDVRE